MNRFLKPTDPLLPGEHRENYERDSAQKTLTAAELHAKLGELIAAGHGARKVFIMECDGMTHAIPVLGVQAAEPFDGDIVWIFDAERS